MGLTGDEFQELVLYITLGILIAFTAGIIFGVVISPSLRRLVRILSGGFPDGFGRTQKREDGRWFMK